MHLLTGITIMNSSCFYKYPGLISDFFMYYGITAKIIKED